jgi:glucosamine--fructose-6-phosphate aminotransferase (isomerizing)
MQSRISRANAYTDGPVVQGGSMCGIVGYTGPREAGPILLEGLRRLEYRGYDSAGIALVDDDGDLFVEKRAGKLANLRTAIADRTPHAAIGLAHTRWATHGRPNDLNAHPHVDCTGTITVIHNGIIENFRELRDGLETRGHTLRSETDTEAIAHLVEEAYAGDLADAVRAALRQVRGAYALAVMHRAETDRLVGARCDVPLVVGVADGETFLASDVAAILADTNRVIFLEEGDVADLHAGSVVVTDLDGRIHERTITVVDWTPEAAEKGGYAHFMEKEIHEQPQALRQAIGGRVGIDGAIAVHELEPVLEAIRAADRVELVACGTAYYAALVGAAAIERWAGIPARATVGSEFRYSPPPLDGRALVVAVTQSGETADTIAPTRLARELGAPVVAVTNTVGSAITREADAVLFLQAGPEVAVAASKTFVTQVATLVILAAAIAKARGVLPEADERELGDALRALPDAAQTVLDRAAPTAAGVARRYVNMHGFMYVGRAFSLPAALEGALKLKEVSYVHAEGYAAGELKHGPISLLDAEYPLVAVATRSAVYEKLISNVMEARARDARVLAVASDGDDQIERFADDVWWVPDVPEPLSPILAVIPLQLFAYHTAVARGTDVDQPRNLAKSVTVE